jgi:hypothetical protein
MSFAEELSTLSETINHIRKEGFLEDFEVRDNHLIGRVSKKTFNPEELTILKVYRFEGASDPDDMSVLYAIKSDSDVKGIFVDAFGTYAAQDGQNAAELLSKLKIAKDH